MDKLSKYRINVSLLHNNFNKFSNIIPLSHISNTRLFFLFPFQDCLTPVRESHNPQYGAIGGVSHCFSMSWQSNSSDFPRRCLSHKQHKSRT